MIINNIAHIVNEFVLSLYSNGIQFYKIILGLFIFNFIIYEIRQLILQARIRY